MKTRLALLSALLLFVLVLACKKDPDPAPTKSSAKALSSFTFGSLSPAVVGTVSGNTVMATVPFGTAVTALAPTIVVSDKATVSPASGVAKDFTNAVTYTVTAEDGTTQVYTVSVGVGVAPKSPAKDITAFAFNGLTPAVNCTIDATTKVISGTLPAGTDLTKLVPTLTLSPKATVTPATGLTQDFSKAVTYTVTAEDGTTQAYVANLSVAAVATGTACRLSSYSIVDSGSNTIRFTYEVDAQNRLVKQTDIYSYVTQTTLFTYDANGYMTQSKTTYSYTKPDQYSLKEDLKTYTYATGRLVKVVYMRSFADAARLSEQSTDQLDYDSQGRVSTFVQTPLGGTGVTSTFVNGILTSVTSAKSTFEITQGAVTKRDDSGGYYTLYKYNAAGQKISEEVYGAGKKSRYELYEYSTVKPLAIPTNPAGLKGQPAVYPSLLVRDGGYRLSKVAAYSVDAAGKETLDLQLVYTQQIDGKGYLTASTVSLSGIYGSNTDRYTYTYQGCQ